MDFLHRFPDRTMSSPSQIAGTVLKLSPILLLVYFAGLVFYNLFLHPLRRFPGPKLWAMTRIPYTRNQLSGEAPRRMLALHLKYGPVVRVAPEILSINHPDGMKELRGHRHAGQPEHGKDPIHVEFQSENLLGANRENHARSRRVLAHAFSAQAMAEQEPLMKLYIDKLLSGLKNACSGGTKVVDILGWYNWTTFDIIGDLAFGEPFGSLDDTAYHPWVALIFQGIKSTAFGLNANRYPLIAPLLKLLIPSELKTKMVEHKELSIIKLKKRLEADTQRPDFVDKMLQGKGSKGVDMSFTELASTAALLIIAGSETTATVLTAATYHLTANPETLAKLTAEVRGAFASEDEITIASSSNLKYMLAVLEETLRIYPPVPSGSPRKIAEGGGTIIDQFIPEDTIVEIWQWALYNNPNYFTKPEAFVPERWLGDPRFAGDRLEAVQPFSMGPRNCIGRNLAYAEMRLILARMIWNFDLKITPQSRNWAADSKTYLLWQKPQLDIAVTPRQF